MAAPLPTQCGDRPRLLFSFAGEHRLVAPQRRQRPLTRLFCAHGRQFYERTCINEQMKMQARGVAPEQMFEMSKRMSGVEYQVHHEQV